MKGLLLKDGYTLVKQTKIFAILVLIFACIPGYSMSAFAVVYAAMLPITALAYDERSKWGQLAAMLPYSTRQLVFSKYLLGYIGIAAAAIISAIAQTVICIIKKSPVESELFYGLFMVVCLAACMLSFCMPALFKFGVEKGRLLLMLILAAVVVLGMSTADSLAQRLNAGGVGTVMLICALATVIINVISVELSIAFVKNKNE